MLKYQISKTQTVTPFSKNQNRQHKPGRMSTKGQRSNLLCKKDLTLITLIPGHRGYRERYLKNTDTFEVGKVKKNETTIPLQLSCSA